MRRAGWYVSVAVMLLQGTVASYRTGQAQTAQRAGRRMVSRMRIKT
jgi:hypothetical protein